MGKPQLSRIEREVVINYAMDSPNIIYVYTTEFTIVKKLLVEKRFKVTREVRNKHYRGIGDNLIGLEGYFDRTKARIPFGKLFPRFYRKKLKNSNEKK